MNILVTGGSGYLGKHLIQALLTAGHQVENIDLLPSELVKTTIADIQNVSAIDAVFAGKDAVFHLASLIEVGESVQFPEKYMQNNVLGTVHVLECMRKHQVQKFIFSSSAAVYGTPKRVPILEDDRTLPINPYGTSKLAMEGLASSYAYNFGMSCAALRYFNLYGPGWHNRAPSHAIPRFFEQMEQGKEVTIWGSGEHKRDYVYMQDIVRAHLLALQLQPGYHYLNLSGKNATRVIDLIHLMAKIMGKEPNLKHFPERPGDPLELFADATKAKEILNWEAEVDLEEGLRQTIEWYRKNPRTV